MRKILLASPYNQAGGIARWTGHIVDYWKSIGEKTVSIDVLHEPSPLYKGFNNKNVLRRLITGVYTYAGYIYNEYNHLRKKECDVIHICTSASLGLVKDLLMIVVAKHFHVPVVVHFRFGRIPELFEKKNWEYKMLTTVIKKSNQTITIDRKSYKTLRDAGFEKVINIPNPISPSILGQIIERNEDRLNNLVLFVGQCYEGKGIFELLEVAETMKESRFRFVGSISPETKEEMNKRKGTSENIEIVGELPYKEVIKEMQKCSVFVLPTYTEGFPNVILEAMACGCPIVTTDVGAIPEMLDIENGFNYGICVKPRDVEGLKNAMQKMLDDREYAIRCGENAQKRVNELYSMPKVWNQLVNIWERLQ